MRNLVLLTVLMILVTGALVGCGGGDQAAASDSVPTTAPEGSGAVLEESMQAESYTSTVLVTSYEEALPASSQLALGIFRLQDTGNAVTPEQAKTLLPLWQAVQSGSLQNDAETNAVLKQIEAAMTDEQLAVIAGMQLTGQDLVAWMQEQGLNFGPGPGGPEGRGRFAEMSEEERDALRATRQAGGEGGFGRGGFGDLSEEERANMRATAEASGFTFGAPGGPGPGGPGRGLLTVLAEPLVELLSSLARG